MGWEAVLQEACRDMKRSVPREKMCSWAHHHFVLKRGEISGKETEKEWLEVGGIAGEFGG